MKIIDIHTHLADYSIYHEDYIYGMVEGTGLNVKKEQFLKISKIFLNDPFGDKQVRTMDEAGIEKSVLLIVDSEIELGKFNLSLEEIYEKHRLVLEKHPDRFFVFAGVDPRRENAFSFIKKGYDEFKFSGVKLYPSFGFEMNHPNLLPVYEFCSSKNIPVLFHTGPSIARLNFNNFADPTNILTICKQFTCPFILAHAGFKLNNKEVSELLDLPNIYVDISGYQSMDLKDPKNVENLAFVFDKKYSEKVLFGSDWPLFHTLSHIKKDIEFVSNLFEESLKNETIDVDRSSLEKIMYKNAEKILYL
jgi:predicted TIM-barrel fold metal-dependent hydrolase